MIIPDHSFPCASKAQLLSNRTSGFPQYGSPTIFPISLSVTKLGDHPNRHKPSSPSILLRILRLPLVGSLCFRFRNIRRRSQTEPFSSSSLKSTRVKAKWHRPTRPTSLVLPFGRPESVSKRECWNNRDASGENVSGYKPRASLFLSMCLIAKSAAATGSSSTAKVAPMTASAPLVSSSVTFLLPRT